MTNVTEGRYRSPMFDELIKLQTMIKRYGNNVFFPPFFFAGHLLRRHSSANLRSDNRIAFFNNVEIARPNKCTSKRYFARISCSAKINNDIFRSIVVSCFLFLFLLQMPFPLQHFFWLLTHFACHEKNLIKDSMSSFYFIRKREYIRQRDKKNDLIYFVCSICIFVSFI